MILKVDTDKALHQVALLLQLIPNNPDWSQFTPPEGRTRKACHKKVEAMKAKVKKARDEEEKANSAAAAATASTKPAHKTGPKKTKNEDSEAGKPTTGKKRKAESDAEDSGPGEPFTYSKNKTAETKGK